MMVGKVASALFTASIIDPSIDCSIDTKILVQFCCVYVIRIMHSVRLRDWRYSSSSSYACMRFKKLYERLKNTVGLHTAAYTTNSMYTAVSLSPPLTYTPSVDISILLFKLKQTCGNFSCSDRFGHYINYRSRNVEIGVVFKVERK